MYLFSISKAKKLDLQLGRHNQLRHNRVRLQVDAVQLGAPTSGCAYNRVWLDLSVCSCDWDRYNWVWHILFHTVFRSASGSGTAGSGWFWASWIRIGIRNLFVRIRILQSTCKKIEKSLDLYCFVTFFMTFFKQDPHPDPDLLAKCTDPRIRNTGFIESFTLVNKDGKISSIRK